jgi:hypothetical protein
MSSLRVIDLWVLFLWMSIDAVIVFRRGAGAVSRDDRFSMQAIVLANWIGLGVAIYLGVAGIGDVGAHRSPVQLVGLALLAVGIVFRSVAIAHSDASTLRSSPSSPVTALWTRGFIATSVIPAISERASRLPASGWGWEAG